MIDVMMHKMQEHTVSIRNAIEAIKATFSKGVAWWSPCGALGIMQSSVKTSDEPVDIPRRPAIFK